MNMFALAAGGLLAAGGAYLAFVQKKKTEGMLTELKFMKAMPLQELHGTWKSLCDEGMGDGFGISSKPTEPPPLTESSSLPTAGSLARTTRPRS